MHELVSEMNTELTKKAKGKTAAADKSMVEYAMKEGVKAAMRFLGQHDASTPDNIAELTLLLSDPERLLGLAKQVTNLKQAAIVPPLNPAAPNATQTSPGSNPGQNPTVTTGPQSGSNPATTPPIEPGQGIPKTGDDENPAMAEYAKSHGVKFDPNGHDAGQDGAHLGGFYSWDTVSGEVIIYGEPYNAPAIVLTDSEDQRKVWVWTPDELMQTLKPLLAKYDEIANDPEFPMDSELAPNVPGAAKREDDEEAGGPGEFEKGMREMTKE